MAMTPRGMTAASSGLMIPSLAPLAYMRAISQMPAMKNTAQPKVGSSTVKPRVRGSSVIASS